MIGKWIFRMAVLATLLVAATATADDIVILDTWNVGDIQDAGDYVEVVIDDYDELLGGTTATFRWIEGDTGDDLWTASGIDTIYYNTDSFAAVLAVLADGLDVTTDWSLNFGSGSAGGGFGDFISLKNLDGGGTGGIDPSTITLVFDGIVNFIDNGAPNFATFAVHTRYGQACSGWASDGVSISEDTSDGACSPTQIPEPRTLALFGLGLLTLGLGRRRRARPALAR